MEGNTKYIKDASEIDEIVKDEKIDIILELMDNQLTEEELSTRLKISHVKLQCYIYRLIEMNVVEKIEEHIVSESVISKYKLTNENLEMIFNKGEESNSKNTFVFEYSYYMKILKKALKCCMKNSNLPSKYGMVFIHSTEKNIIEFKKELNSLIQKFIELEEKEANDTFVFMPMLLPYEVEGEDNEANP